GPTASPERREVDNRCYRETARRRRETGRKASSRKFSVFQPNRPPMDLEQQLEVATQQSDKGVAMALYKAIMRQVKGNKTFRNGRYYLRECSILGFAAR